MKVTFAVPVDGYSGLPSVVGDFNDWDPAATPLVRRRNMLTASVVLDGGRRYAFRYLGDRDGEGERWFNDEAADAYEPNGMGADNSIVDLTTPR